MSLARELASSRQIVKDETIQGRAMEMDRLKNGSSIPDGHLIGKSTMGVCVSGFTGPTH